MAKKDVAVLQTIIHVSTIISKTTIYLLLFFIPLIAVPLTTDILDFNKQTALVILIFIGLTAWMARAIASGSFSLRYSYLNVAVLCFTAAYFLATVFSTMRYGSFWGYPLLSSASFLSVICFVAVFFLVSNLFEESEIPFLLTAVGFSALCVQGYAIVQMFGLKNSFNTIGSVGSLGLFAAILLPLFIMAGITTKGWPAGGISFLKLAGEKKWQRSLFFTNIALSLGIFLLINYPVVWWVVFAGALSIVVCWFFRRHIFDGRWLFLPMFFLVVSLFFALFHVNLPQRVNVVEVSLSHRATMQVNSHILAKSPIVGTGPGTFGHDFSQYKDNSITQSQLWNIIFPTGSSWVLTAMAELGIVGFISLVALLGIFLFYAVRRIVPSFNIAEWQIISGTSPTDNREYEQISLVALCLPPLVAATVAAFLYPSNVSLQFIWFFCAALSSIVLFTRQHTYDLRGSSLATMAFALAFSVILIFGAGIVLLESQRYVAELLYRRGMVLAAAQKTDKGMALIRRAIINNPSVDLYFNKFALLSLLKLQGNLVSKDHVQGLVSDTISAANAAVALGPRNPDNWSTKAYVCQNFIGVYADAPTCALESYEKSIRLDPQNPYLLLQRGNVYLTQARLADTRPAEKTKLFNQAIESYQKAVTLKKDYAVTYVHIGVAYYEENNFAAAQNAFEKSLRLSPDYADALYYAGLTYDQQGLKDRAITTFSRILKNNPDNQTIKKIIENLRAGKAALDGLTQKTAPTAPSTSSVPPVEQKKVAQ